MINFPKTKTIGKNKKLGVSPAIILTNPKYPHNVAATLRAASCFDIKQVIFSGNRVSLDPNKKQRLPREERMKGYKEVDLIQNNYPFDLFNKDVTPIGIEVKPGSECLLEFEHPENAVYVFGPEDGNLNKVASKHCHRFVSIPTKHCTNLSAAVYIILYDRMIKNFLNGKLQNYRIEDIMKENRVWCDQYADCDNLVY